MIMRSKYCEGSVWRECVCIIDSKRSRSECERLCDRVSEWVLFERNNQSVGYIPSSHLQGGYYEIGKEEN